MKGTKRLRIEISAQFYFPLLTHTTRAAGLDLTKEMSSSLFRSYCRVPGRQSQGMRIIQTGRDQQQAVPGGDHAEKGRGGAWP